MTQGNLAAALQLLAARDDNHEAQCEMLVEAAETFFAALDVFEESLGDEHVLTQSARGSLRSVFAAIELPPGDP